MDIAYEYEMYVNNETKNSLSETIDLNVYTTCVPRVQITTDYVHIVSIEKSNSTCLCINW